MQGAKWDTMFTLYLIPLRRLVVNILMIVLILFEIENNYFKIEALNTFLGLTCFFAFLGTFNMDENFAGQCRECIDHVVYLDDLVILSSCKEVTAAFMLYMGGAMSLALFLVHFLLVAIYKTCVYFYQTCCKKQKEKLDKQFKENFKQRKRKYKKHFTKQGMEPSMDYRLDVRTPTASDDEAESNSAIIKKEFSRRKME